MQCFPAATVYVLFSRGGQRHFEFKHRHTCNAEAFKYSKCKRVVNFMLETFKALVSEKKKKQLC